MLNKRNLLNYLLLEFVDTIVFTMSSSNIKEMQYHNGVIREKRSQILDLLDEEGNLIECRSFYQEEILPHWSILNFHLSKVNNMMKKGDDCGLEFVDRFPFDPELYISEVYDEISEKIVPFLETQDLICRFLLKLGGDVSEFVE